MVGLYTGELIFGGLYSEVYGNVLTLGITINYDGYVNLLCTSGFSLMLGHSNSNNTLFQCFWVFFETPCTGCPKKRLPFKFKLCVNSNNFIVVL